MVEITVIGNPAPQGSKRPLRNQFTGKIQMTENSAKVKPWREAVKCAARDAIEHTPAVAGPVEVAMVFTVPKPKSAPKNRRIWPDKKPDVDKLARSTADALVEAGVIEDDSRIVWLTAAKVFPHEGKRALGVPGAFIVVRSPQA